YANRFWQSQGDRRKRLGEDETVDGPAQKLDTQSTEALSMKTSDVTERIMESMDRLFSITGGLREGTARAVHNALAQPETDLEEGTLYGSMKASMDL
ncbi:unnamed protein product, partial [Chrysoparadoxa australica]